MTKTSKLSLWAVIALVLVCIVLAWLALQWGGAVTDINQTQTQNALEATWDAE